MSSTTSETKRVAIITGAAEGIGRAIALRLAKDGYDLGLFDLPRARERLEAVAEEVRTAHGARVVNVYGDVSKEDDVRILVETVVQELGSVYAMIANAGICINQVLHETTSEEADKLLDINVKGTFYSFKYAAIQMIKQGTGGRLVGAASIAGKRGYAEHALYSASKFAVRAIVQCAALDYGQYGITVNAYAPGACETSLLTGVDEHFATKNGEPIGTYKVKFRDGNALKRNARPEDIANLASFFVSDDASFITGQSYLVDGGTCFD
ncbi:acetoin dehydrogenase [Trametes versicolor FP-101664 SS1]|uniref:acetoin dehydrogenase n=1 Tax=Trametes versicolor (strain FP-101664) TaxID=717944 RepID=UPI00046220F3|nr:acetoin dehydrogenase [Trametes versicolor FP-101664 SS1]EIW55713.1 acetoin dehydrogenase [Trametes versicolor FP-101664 SS1]